jgi:voltage-gated potassium channel
MVETAMDEAERKRRRRLIAAGVLRASVTAGVLLAVYFIVPIDEPLQGSAAIRLIACLIVFAGVVIWQVRSILRSRYPGIRAAEALAFTVPLFLLIFASTYFLLADSSSANFGQAMTRTDALYFTVTTFATVGFGDIVADSQPARAIVTIQMILDLLILGLGVRALLGVVRIGKERQAATIDDQVSKD